MLAGGAMAFCSVSVVAQLAAFEAGRALRLKPILTCIHPPHR